MKSKIKIDIYVIYIKTYFIKLRKEKKEIHFVECDYIEESGDDEVNSDIDGDWIMGPELKETLKACVIIF
jgi:hypothetical protein